MTESSRRGELSLRICDALSDDAFAVVGGATAVATRVPARYELATWPAAKLIHGAGTRVLSALQRVVVARCPPALGGDVRRLRSGYGAPRATVRTKSRPA